MEPLTLWTPESYAQASARERQEQASMFQAQALLWTGGQMRSRPMKVTESSIRDSVRTTFSDGKARTFGEIKTAMPGSANTKAQSVSRMVDEGLLVPTGGSKNGKELYAWAEPQV